MGRGLHCGCSLDPEFLRGTLPENERVLVVGSDGISHAPPSLVPGARDLTEAERQKLITDILATATEATTRTGTGPSSPRSPPATGPARPS